MRRFWMWVSFNVPVPGWLAPRVLGWALGSKAVRMKPRRIVRDVRGAEHPLAWMDETPMRDFHDDCGDR